MRSDRKRDARMDDLVREALRKPHAGAVSADASPQGADCLPAEDFAAFLEGSLSQAEQLRLEDHLAACPSCRAVIGFAAESEPAGVPEAAGIAVAARRWWIPQPTLRWFAPAAAAMVGVVLYIVVAGGPATDRSAVSISAPGATVAERQTPGEQAHVRGREAPASSAEASGKAETRNIPEAKAESGRRAAASTSAGAPSGPAKEPPAAAPVPSEPIAPNVPPAALPTGARPEALLVAPPPAVAGEGVAKRVVTEEAPGRIPAQQTATTAMADKVRADKMADARAGAAVEKGQVVGGVAGGVVGGVAGGFVPKAALAESIAPAPGEARPVRAVSPDGTTEWQFETGGGIRRSTDGGRTWFPQPSGAAGGVLLAASAPASNVCWAVGRKGLVIMTADGNRWLARQSPDATDLVAVAARDASNAVVTTADGRRFETTDGGTTWSLIR